MKTKKEIQKKIDYYDYMIKKYDHLALPTHRHLRNLLLWVLDEPKKIKPQPKIKTNGEREPF